MLLKLDVFQLSKPSTWPGRSRPTFLLHILKALGGLCVTAVRTWASTREEEALCEAKSGRRSQMMK